MTYNILILLGILFSTANNNSHQTSRKGQPQLNLGQPLLRTVALFGFKLAQSQHTKVAKDSHFYALCTVDLYEGSPQWIHGPLRK